MPLTEDHVREELKKVIDPELFVNIVDLGLIYTVDIKRHGEGFPASEAKPAEAEAGEPVTGAEAPVAENTESQVAAESEQTEVATASSTEGMLDVFIEMTLTSPMCPAGPQLIAQSKAAVGAIEEVVDVEVKVVLDPPWTPDKMTDDARDQLGIF
jgi:metal-sulfur cluster biosynthetic enzyme